MKEDIIKYVFHAILTHLLEFGRTRMGQERLVRNIKLNSSGLWRLLYFGYRLVLIKGLNSSLDPLLGREINVPHLQVAVAMGTDEAQRALTPALLSSHEEKRTWTSIHVRCLQQLEPFFMKKARFIVGWWSYTSFFLHSYPFLLIVVTSLVKKVRVLTPLSSFHGEPWSLKSQNSVSLASLISSMWGFHSLAMTCLTCWTSWRSWEHINYYRWLKSGPCCTSGLSQWYSSRLLWPFGETLTTGDRSLAASETFWKIHEDWSNLAKSVLAIKS